MTMSGLNRNVALLALSAAVATSINALIAATAALVGNNLATDKALATLPVALMFAATMCTSIPAGLLMQRIGRKAAFLWSSLFGIAGGMLATLAIMRHSFWLFVLATICIGVFSGFANFYRFAAADTVAVPHKGKAVSMVMYVLILIALTFLHLGETKPGVNAVGATAANARPLGTIVRQPKYLVALICGLFGYCVMIFVMTATPLSMQGHAFHFDATSTVIQWHVVAMFAPSFVTGSLIARFGVATIMGVGAVIGLVCVGVNLSGASYGHYLVGLMLLGLSWNFLFVGSTTLLTETYTQAEKNKAQAFNDFIVFTAVALASLSAGTLQNRFGWDMVNFGALPLLVAALAGSLWLVVLNRRTRDAGLAQA